MPRGFGFISLIIFILDVYAVLILIRAVMSWFVRDYRNQIYHILIKVTEPVLAPLRRVLPRMGVDISPMVAIVLIQIAIRVLRTFFIFQ
ncbi:MAG: YggT family protein [Candidatus Cloacimonadaceae bacterium]|jgi:YggT family protein|nr:YggT family protein [Candidatus Cloacimonadota bacterium]MDX9949696.1 YggT family protein [Candidatus Syntrophosphaera sp.]NLN85160.1 YggT family protein [Candidatus Cloacimonadota bacterium]